ncbi:MAG: LacI family DNA-binding transcriptional regulator [Bacteroidota bacterium]
MRAKSVTLKDLARELGLSKSTVSRALRGHPKVKVETKIAVKALAEAWGYEPDLVARSLVQRQSFTIGVVIPRIEFPYFAMALGGAQEVASKAGYNLVICQSNESYEIERSVIRTLVSSKVDGLLISITGQTTAYDHMEDIHKHRLPIVLFDRILEGDVFPMVSMDNVRGALIATEHLLTQGYRRIAHIAGPPDLFVSRQRIQGYRQALQNWDIPFREEYLVSSGFRMNNGEEAMKKLLDLDQPPDAVLAVSDNAALGAKKVIEAEGFTIPDQIGLIGFNGEPLSKVVRPSLTTVSLPMAEMGRVSVKLLLKHIVYPAEPRPHEMIILPPQLLVRESSLKPEQV